MPGTIGGTIRSLFAPDRREGTRPAGAPSVSGTRRSKCSDSTSNRSSIRRRRCFHANTQQPPQRRSASIPHIIKIRKYDPSITTSFLFLKGNHSYPYTTNSFLSNPLNKSSTTALSARNAIINLIDTPLGAPVVRTSQRYAAGPSDG